MSGNILATYISDCVDSESINNPMVGHSAGMRTVGHFNKVAPSILKAYSGDSLHTPRGGLEKTTANGASIFCENATKLFSMSSGEISIRLSFPEHDIRKGVYKGMPGTIGSFEDFVIFGVNLGEHYISQPGLYGSLTKNGIEFTVWSSAGRYSLLEKTVNVQAGKDLILTFIWGQKGILNDSNINMKIVANDKTATRKASISSDSLFEVGGPNKPASFWLLDTPYRKSDLNVIIRRIEIFPEVEVSNIKPPAYVPPPAEEIVKSGVSKFNFEIMASQEAVVEIEPPEFYRVSTETVDMRAIGPISSSSHRTGQDFGSELPEVFPAPLFDLPPGFIETRGIET